MEDKWYNMVQYQQKTVKCRIQNTNWDKIPDLTKHVVEAIELLCTSKLCMWKLMVTTLSLLNFIVLIDIIIHNL